MRWLPFTKDLTYIKGFVLTYNFMRLAVSKGKPDRIPLLFCGKTMIEDMKVLVDLVEEGTVIPPRFLPPQFTDLMGLSAWLSFSRFMASMNFRQLERPLYFSSSTRLGDSRTRVLLNSCRSLKGNVIINAICRQTENSRQ